MSSKPKEADKSRPIGAINGGTSKLFVVNQYVIPALSFLMTVILMFGGYWVRHIDKQLTSTVATVQKHSEFIAAATETMKVQTAAIATATETLAEHSKILASIQSNRFTASDGLQLYKDLELMRDTYRKEIAQIRLEITQLRGEVPREVPPAWFLDEFRKLEAKVDAIGEAVTMLKARSS